MARRVKKKRGTLADVEHGVRVELRAILRQYHDLRSPFDRFEVHPFRGEGDPRFFVAFDRTERRDIAGLRVRMQKLVLPDERILEGLLRFAESVWQLKDRLRQLARVKGARVDIEGIANGSECLLVCADLANAKKHGRCDNRSGLNPRLGVFDESPERTAEGVVQFDTSNSGVVELFYDGPRKRKELLVTKPVPIPFRVDILAGDGHRSLGDAVAFIYNAFREWLPMVRQLGVLDADDRESDALRGDLLGEDRRETE